MRTRKSAPKIVVSHLEGYDRGRRDVLRQSRLTFGRSEDCDVRFDLTNQPEVSMVHAELVFPSSGPPVLRDLDSTNGTWVNGHEISESEIQFGDELEFGHGGPKVRIERNEPFWHRLSRYLGLTAKQSSKS